MIKVAIGIQLRKNNSRCPGKALLKINNKELIYYMIENVYRGIERLNKYKHKSNMECSISFLVPTQEYEFWHEKLDPYKHKFDHIFHGNEDDVFSRYIELHDQLNPAYLMRLTGDCPFIPYQLLTKIVNCAVNHRLDYLSNVDPRFRTMPDGFDAEIMSVEAFNWLANNIYKDGDLADLEHVTTYLRANKQPWMRFGILTGNLDMSDQKYSVDTDEDYELLKTMISQKTTKEHLARKQGYGIYDY